jgi:hypothetical protein
MPEKPPAQAEQQASPKNVILDRRVMAEKAIGDEPAGEHHPKA